MRFSDDDINRLIRAVEYYKDTTGSEWIWDEYDSLAKKLESVFRPVFSSGVSYV